MKNKAIFLDRDGIINIDRAYVYKFSDIVWVDGIIPLIQFAHANGFLVIVLTNQSGVAQGMYQESDVIKLHEEMNKFLSDKNAQVDDWFYCTEYDSPDRKPRPGMMIKARDKHNIDLSKSFMIGDKPTDVLEIDGPITFLLKGNYPLDKVLTSEKVKIFSTLSEIKAAIKEKL